MDNRCSPAYSEQTVSCFTKEALLKIVRGYNSRNLDPIRVGNSQSKKEIWEAIQNKMSQKCGSDEVCWLDQPGVKNMTELNEYFKPLAPLGRYQWLSTDDINSVMKQYESKYPDFKFVGPVPMDFLTLDDNDSKFLQNLNLNQVPYRNIGIILNMDPSTSGGSHWISMCINTEKREINFFDSYGDKHTYPNTYYLPHYDSYGNYHRDERIALPPNVQKFVLKTMLTISPEFRNIVNVSGDPKKINKTINSMNKNSKNIVKMPYDLKVNTIQHQYANSECGVYSMLFVLKSLNNSFENISKDIIADEKANKYRDIFFRRR